MQDTDLLQSPYAYCDGDPVNGSDPSGHLPVNIASPGVPTINGPAWTGSGLAVSGDPGNNPNSTVPAPSGSASIPNGSGGTVTASPSGGETVSDGNDSVIAGGIATGPTTFQYKTNVPLVRGFNLTGSGSYTPSTGASSHSFGGGYMNGPVKLGVSFKF